MADPMRVRAARSGGITTVKILMSHEMETGQRRGANGTLVPAWFIQQVSVRLNDATVLTAQWGPAISKNPFLQVELNGANAGDRVTVAWTDTHGDSRVDEIRVP